MTETNQCFISIKLAIGRPQKDLHIWWPNWDWFCDIKNRTKIRIQS